MDRRSWPWKKKSSDKSSPTDALQSSNQGEQDEKVPKFVQISSERYEHLTELEEQVKLLNEKINVLNEKVSAAQKENTTKDGLVKQHAKVAEEAVSGWEQAEAEASALKVQLETVTLSKLAAEERSAHLDGALKECMKQVRTVKEESEQKLHDVVFAKTKQWEKIKDELEARLAEFEQELIRAGAENDALSRSLEERANLLMRIDEEKAQAEAEIEVLKSTIESGEKEINSLKYELHVVSKELDIRNEEKNMSVRSSDVATKQHLEDVKKISKLEAECQRLRGLVRKKLPGPAALAQMKMEVDSWGRDQGDNRLRRSPSRSSTFQHPMPPSPDYALENLQKMQKENEYLTARLLLMEQETKMLKEALSKCNNELQASKNLCAKTAGKLRSMELNMLSGSLYKSPTNSYIDTSFDGASSQKGSNPPSLTSMSEDGVDDAKSCEEFWANSLVSKFSHFKKDKGGKRSLTENSNQMGLMDDFLEMERLACLSSEAKGCDGIVDKKKVGKVEETLSTITKKESDKNSSPALQSPGSPSSSAHLTDNSPLSKLHSRIFTLLSSQSPQNNVVKVLDGIRNIVRDIEEEAEFVNLNKIQHDNIVDYGSSTKQAKALVIMDHGLKNAISKIHEFVKSLIRRASELQGSSSHYDAVSQKIEQFSRIVDKVLSDGHGHGLNEIVIALSEILLESGEVKLALLRESVNEAESNNVDCVDKVTLLENKVHQEPPQDSVSGVCSLMPHSSSEPDFEGSPSDASDVKTAIRICTPEEYEKLKLEKGNLEMELMLCNEMIESTNLKFGEMEKNLEDLTSKLAASEKSNNLAETQLKCMAESYKTLELQKVKLEEEIRVLQTKIDNLSADLAEERQIHQEDIAKYRDLEENMERYEKNSLCVVEDSGTKLKQEKEIAAAAEKLAECQETILLLGRQLQTLRPPPAEPLVSALNRQRVGEFSENQAGPAQGIHSKKPSGQFDADYTLSSAPGTGNVSPLNGYSAHKSPSNVAGSPYFTSPSSSKCPKHRSRSSSSSFSSQLPEKQGRGFSRLFSKGKS
ncbi:filament-like plant protein 4 [Phragmites australis]|uniref:filament-like plant protein 4 n=1 Tax=Phragmites australis TaxID=29695 RepID=UPI002D77C520|nr:filament-like plant protein 4 [Phragmites australis]XP_062201129.1 filament-like plant protein 4 [Phragmites australis]XP_062201130.1 filament-like plant protein 4 [Phragmites australis]XP_062201131.1 filament-like plant protein 4 [Phragmites australis]